MIDKLISKDQFCTIIKAIKNNNDFLNELNDLFKKYNQTENQINSSELEDTLVNLLEMLFDDTDTWIKYWIYELEYGVKYKDGSVVDLEDNIIPLKTESDLYDLLLENMGLHQVTSED